MRKKRDVSAEPMNGTDALAGQRKGKRTVRTHTTTCKPAPRTTPKELATVRIPDTRRIKGSGNVFLDLGFDPAEAKVIALRAEVMIRMEQHLKAQGWTQAQAAKRLGITLPRVSRLIKGQWQDFSLDMLLTLAARAGLE